MALLLLPQTSISLTLCYHADGVDGLVVNFATADVLAALGEGAHLLSAGQVSPFAAL